MLEYVVLNTQVVPTKRGPSFIAFRHTRDDDGKDASYIRGEPTLAGFVPGSQRMPDINGIRVLPPSSRRSAGQTRVQTVRHWWH
jgi:hypothetical protein